MFLISLKFSATKQVICGNKQAEGILTPLILGSSRSLQHMVIQWSPMKALEVRCASPPHVDCQRSGVAAFVGHIFSWRLILSRKSSQSTSTPRISSIKGSNPDDKEQSKLFIEKAREIGADEEKSAADALIGKLAKLPPEPRIKSKPK